MNCGLEIYYTHSNMTVLPPFLQRRVQVFDSKGEPKEGKVKMCWSKKLSLKFTLKSQGILRDILLICFVHVCIKPDVIVFLSVHP